MHLPTSFSNDIWGVLTALIFVGGWVLTTWATKGKKVAQDNAGSIEEAVKASMSLAPAVAVLSSEVEKLKRQVAELLPIAQVKYPAALRTVARFRDEHPDSAVVIPPEIVQDLNAR